MSQELHVNLGERLRTSTESLESAFRMYKQLEGQHLEHVFTGLIGALGFVLQDLTEEEHGECSERVGVKNMKQWQKKRLGNTFTSRRRAITEAHNRATLPSTRTTNKSAAK